MEEETLLIRKFPLGFIQKELEKIEPKVLKSLSNSEHKIIQLHELDKKLSEFFYMSKFLNMMCKNNFFNVEVLPPYAEITEKWIRMTEDDLECEKRKGRNNVDGKFIDVIIYEFRRKYKKRK